MALAVAAPVTGGASGRRRWVPLLVGVAVLDLITKVYVRHALGGQRPVRVGILELRLVFNRGAALGVGGSHPGAVTVVAVLITVGLLWWAAHTVSVPRRRALAVAAGGSLGNVMDRLARGSVTDWIHIRGYSPTFNLADVAIRVGMLVTVWLLIRSDLAHDKALR